MHLCDKFAKRERSYSDTKALVSIMHCVSLCINILCWVILVFVFSLYCVGKTVLCLSYTNEILESWIFVVIFNWSLSILFIIVSVSLLQSYDGPSVSEVTLRNMGKIDKYLITAKHYKARTLWLVVRLYCTAISLWKIFKIVGSRPKTCPVGSLPDVMNRNPVVALQMMEIKPWILHDCEAISETCSHNCQ